MRCYAKMMRCHDSLMTSCSLCIQENARCVPDPFLACVVGSGNETSLWGDHFSEERVKF